MEEIDKRVKTRVLNLSKRYPFADQDDIRYKLDEALERARGTYNPTAGKPQEAWEALCLHNAASHLARKLAGEAHERNITDSLEKKVGDGLTLDNLLCDSRNSARRMKQVIDLREYLATLKGMTWAAVVAVLAGYCRSEIARHFNVPRTTFDRVYGPAIQKLAEVVK